MNRNFHEEEHEFLLNVGIDYISLDGLYRIVADNFDPLIPTKENFKAPNWRWIPIQCFF